MLFKVTLLILCASIIVFFIEDFQKLFKKIFSIVGTKLFLPILFASILFYKLDAWILWVLYYYKEIMLYFLKIILKCLPAKLQLFSIAEVILLSIFSVLPVTIMNRISLRNTRMLYKYPYLTSLVIFIISAFVLITH